MAKCQQALCTKDAISDQILFCFTHYALRYSQGERPNGFKFAQLPQEAKAQVGKELFKRLPGGVVPDGEHLYLANTVWWGPELDTIADKKCFGTCLALCLRGEDLIMGINDGPLELDKITGVAGEVVKYLNKVGSEKSVERVVFLNGKAHVLSWGTSGLVQSSTSTMYDARTTIHAEMRVLEYLHLTVGQGCRNVNGSPKETVYIGISKLCCVKCEALIAGYNTWAQGWLTVERKGYHTGVHHQWHSPRALKAATQTIANWQTLKHALE